MRYMKYVEVKPIEKNLSNGEMHEESFINEENYEGINVTVNATGFMPESYVKLFINNSTNFIKLNMNRPTFKIYEMYINYIKVELVNVVGVEPTNIAIELFR